MGVFSKPASSSAPRIAPTRPSIMSDGAMISTPDRASETDVRASNSRLASFTISYSPVPGGAAHPPYIPPLALDGARRPLHDAIFRPRARGHFILLLRQPE